LATHLSQNVAVREARVVPGEAGASSWCKVTIEIASPPASNVITVWVALPLKNWNGRFLGLGGGGWIPGFPVALGLGAPLGFATAITNAGRAYDVSIPPEELQRLVGQNDFLLDGNGRLDWKTLQNFAYRGIHEMTVVGKAVAAEFYGSPPSYSYFSGCSTGGRQGQSEVQRYPGDYDGVLSGAPAINWAHFAMADSWPLTVTNELGPVAQCKLDAANRAAIAECDADDGVRDGLVAEVGACHLDAAALIGTQTDCGVFDGHDAKVINEIWGGPHRLDGSPLWNGIDRAALIHAPAPMDIARARASPFSDRHTEGPVVPSIAAFEAEFDQFVERYGGVMDTSDPDLSGFAENGGKTIIWHGVADDIIPAAGTVHYVDAIRHTLGVTRTDKFLRFYLAPGVTHCGGGYGPPPVALLEPLMNWVERGRAPRAVRSELMNENGGIVRTRPLCPYPERARYRGHGSMDDAANFRCR
jgi:feruloyl esterase